MKRSSGDESSVFMRAERLVDTAVHRRHLASDPLRRLLVAGEVGVDVAMRAVDTQRLAVAAVHDVEEVGRGDLLEQREADVLEDATGRLLLVSGDGGGQARDEAIVDLLTRWRRLAGPHGTREARRPHACCHQPRTPHAHGHTLEVSMAASLLLAPCRCPAA